MKELGWLASNFEVWAVIEAHRWRFSLYFPKLFLGDPAVRNFTSYFKSMASGSRSSILSLILLSSRLKTLWSQMVGMTNFSCLGQQYLLLVQFDQLSENSKSESIFRSFLHFDKYINFLQIAFRGKLVRQIEWLELRNLMECIAVAWLSSLYEHQACSKSFT